MKKLHLNIVLALIVMTAGFTFAGTTAHAETLKIEPWDVTYTGSSMKSNYDPAKAVIKDTMPGDTIEYTVNYINDSKSDATFYMSADVIKTLEEGSIATGGSYTYKITCSEMEEPLFDSETIGGDENASAVVGLNQVNGNEGSYFSLGSLEVGKSGQVTVKVTLDGNSQTNNYMSTLAELEIKFGAEPTDSAREGDKEERHNTVVKRVVNTLDGGTEVVVIEDDSIPLDGGNPLTGDSLFPLVMCGIALFAGLLMILWYFIITRDKKEEEVA